MKSNRTKEKQQYIDDGHTIYDMDGVGGEKKTTKTPAELSRQERRAAIKAAFEVYGPVFLTILLSFGIVMLLISLWLK